MAPPLDDGRTVTFDLADEILGKYFEKLRPRFPEDSFPLLASCCGK